MKIIKQNNLPDFDEIIYRVLFSHQVPREKAA